MGRLGVCFWAGVVGLVNLIFLSMVRCNVVGLASLYYWVWCGFGIIGCCMVGLVGLVGFLC